MTGTKSATSSNTLKTTKKTILIVNNYHKKSALQVSYSDLFCATKGKLIASAFLSKLPDRKENLLETIAGRTRKQELNYVPEDLANILFTLNSSVRRDILSIIKPTRLVSGTREKVGDQEAKASLHFILQENKLQRSPTPV